MLTAAIFSTLIAQVEFVLAANTGSNPQISAEFNHDTIKNKASLVIQFDLANAKQTLSYLESNN